MHRATEKREKRSGASAAQNVAEKLILQQEKSPTAFEANPSPRECSAVSESHGRKTLNTNITRRDDL